MSEYEDPAGGNPERDPEPHEVAETLVLDYDDVVEAMEEFKDWTWGPHSLEPDGRVQVLYNPDNAGGVQAPFLVRAGEGWFWAADYASVTRQSAAGWPWDGVHRNEGMRVASVKELRAAGFPVQQHEHFPIEQIIQGSELLEREPTDVLTVMKAQAKFQASLAATALELLSLLTEEFEYRKTRDELADHPPVTVEETESTDKESAHRSENVIGSPDFPYSGFQAR